MSDITDCQRSWPVVVPAFPIEQRVAVAQIDVGRPAVAAVAARIDYIDVARGLFVIWMVTAHALTLAGVATTHPLQLLRPAGWSTACFVMLSGFGIGTIYGRSLLPAAVLRRKLWRRGGQILAIAFLSNLASMVVTASLAGALTPAYLLDVVAFRIPWSISGVLIPTGVMALVAPALLGLQRRFRPVTLLVIFVGLNLAYNVAALGWPAADALSRIAAVFSFPVVALWLCSASAFALALVASHPPRRAEVGLLLAGGAAALAVLLLAWYPWWLVEFPSITSLARFLVSLCIAMAIVRVAMLAWLRSALIAAGRSALLIFILHRPLLRALSALFEGRSTPPDVALALIALGWAACIGLGLGRLRAPALSHALHRVGL